MGARGPKPRSSTQRAREGYSAAKAESDPFRVGVPVMPKGLRPAARECWKRLVAEMQAAGRARLIDRDVLLLACENWADFVEHSKTLREQGPVVTGSQGQPMTNPMVRVVKWAESTYLQCRDQLSLTQSKRDRIPAKGGGTGEPEDPMAKFNARRPEGPPPGFKVTHG